MSVIFVTVSVANNFVQPQTAGDYGYHSFGDLTRFIYCLFQEIQQGSSLPLVEQKDQNVRANLPKSPLPIADEEFLSGTRVPVALNKVGRFYLKKEFSRVARRFVEDFTNLVLSTIGARLSIGHDLFCFCPAFVADDDDAPLDRLGLLLDGLLWKG